MKQIFFILLCVALVGCSSARPNMWQTAWDDTVKEVKAYDYSQITTFLGADELPPLPDTGWRPVKNPHPRYHPARR